MKKQAIYNEWKVVINDDNSVSVFKNEKRCSNSTKALREIASKVDFSFGANWNTRQKGSKLVDFLNSNAPQPSVLKQKNNVRVEVEIIEHEYAAFDSNDEMAGGESFAFNSDEGPSEVRIYVDGEEVDFDWEDDFNEYSEYQTFDLEKKWNNDDIVKFGYYDNVATKVWDFDVEKFDIKKLGFYYKCFDVQFTPADHNREEHIITLRYDNQIIEEDAESYQWSGGEFVQRWCMWEDVKTQLEQKYDKVNYEENIFFVQFKGKWGLVDAKGNEIVSPRYDWMGNGFVDGIITFGFKGSGVGYVNASGVEIAPPKYQLGSDFCNGYAHVMLNDKWGFIDKSGKEIIPLPHEIVWEFVDGKAKAILNGKEFEMSETIYQADPADDKQELHGLSHIFGSLACLMADIDDETADEKVGFILSIAEQFDEFDADLVRLRLMLEKMGICDYDSYPALAKEVPEEHRVKMLMALTMVSVSDFKIKSREMNLLSRLVNVWNIDCDYANNLINHIIERINSSHPATVTTRTLE